MPDSPTVATDEPERGFQVQDRRPPGQHTLKLLAAPIITLIVISTVGDASAPHLVDHHPLLLLAMNARNKNLILVTNYLDAPTYYVVGALRLLLSDPLFFLVGYWYGDAALDWMERRTKSFGDLLRQVERWFGKAAYPLVFIAPNNYICMFAGASGMAVPGFFAVNIAGTLVRLYLIRRLGETFDEPIDDVIGFIRDYRLPLLIVSIALFGFLMLSELRQTKAEFDAIAEGMDDDEADAEAEPEDDPPVS
jgi:membrane protein DedA with SNARE-associated domain